MKMLSGLFALLLALNAYGGDLLEVKGFAPEMSHADFKERAEYYGGRSVYSADDYDLRSKATFNGNFTIGGARVAQLYLIERFRDGTREILVEVGRFGPQEIVRLAVSMRERLGEPSERTMEMYEPTLIWNHSDGGGFTSLAEDEGWLTIVRTNQVSDGVDDF